MSQALSIILANVLGAKFDRILQPMAAVLLTTLLRAVGYSSDIDILNLFYEIKDIKISKALDLENVSTLVLVEDAIDAQKGVVLARAFEPLSPPQQRPRSERAGRTMEQGRTLEPRDIVVMCPDIESLAPRIHATVGAGGVVEEAHLPPGERPPGQPVRDVAFPPTAGVIEIDAAGDRFRKPVQVRFTHHAAKVYGGHGPVTRIRTPCSRDSSRCTAVR